MISFDVAMNLYAFNQEASLVSSNKALNDQLLELRSKYDELSREKENIAETAAAAHREVESVLGDMRTLSESFEAEKKQSAATIEQLQVYTWPCYYC